MRATKSRLFYYDRARFDVTEYDSVLVVYDGPCPAGRPEVQSKTRFLEIVAENGCTLTADQGRPLMEEAGIDMHVVSAMLPFLQNDGTLSVSADNQVFRQTDEACNDYGP